jgi:hypothetical protein
MLTQKYERTATPHRHTHLSCVDANTWFRNATIAFETEVPSAPRHLSKEAKAWADVVRTYVLKPHHLNSCAPRARPWIAWKARGQ